VLFRWFPVPGAEEAKEGNGMRKTLWKFSGWERSWDGFTMHWKNYFLLLVPAPGMQAPGKQHLCSLPNPHSCLEHGLAYRWCSCYLDTFLAKRELVGALLVGQHTGWSFLDQKLLA
jgi:hypothetical protein